MATAAEKATQAESNDVQESEALEVALTERSCNFFQDLVDRAAYRIVNSLFWISLLTMKEQGEIPSMDEVFSDENRGLANTPDQFIFNREIQSSPNQAPLPGDSAYGSVYSKKGVSGRQYEMIQNNSDNILNGAEALAVMKELGFEPCKSREDLYQEVLVQYRDSQAKRRAQDDANSTMRQEAAKRAASEVNIGI